MSVDGFPRAEEALRLLAGAAGTSRLYPPTSALPREAVARFVERVAALTVAGPLRYIVEAQAIKIGDTELASGQSQVTTLAESLHALQVEQLVIAPGVTAAETEAFIALANSDPATVRAEGGARAWLSGAGVRHIAVIEVWLRAGDTSGLADLDLLGAPLEDIARDVAHAAERRQRALEDAGSDTAPKDEVAEALGHLEDATRGLAAERVAAALMRLDEATRLRVLEIALAAGGGPADGLLEVVARMKPAALARLLRLAAASTGASAERIAGRLSLPPETAKTLTILLAPTPDEGSELVQDTRDAADIAAEVMGEQSSAELDRRIAEAALARSAERALSTAIAISHHRVDADTPGAIGKVLPGALRSGAFSTVREALRRLDEIGAEPAYASAVQSVRASIADPIVLRDMCHATKTDADAAIAGEILIAAGTAGAEALLDSYIRMPKLQRSLMHPVLRALSEPVIVAARSLLQTAPAVEAAAIVRALAALGDRRATAVIAEALDSSLEEQVRFSAVTALAHAPFPEAEQALIRALCHREIETQRYVVREVGRARIASAVPALVRLFDDMSVMTRGYEIRKEIISALASIDSAEARRALGRFSVRVALGRKSRELKRLARDAAGIIPRQGVDVP